MKTYSHKTAAAMLKSVMKSAAKNNHPEMSKAWIDEGGFTCACDGFRAYRVAVSPFGLDDYEKTYADKAPVDLLRVFKGMDEREMISIPAPDPAAIRAFIQEEKKTGANKGIYSLGDGLPFVNMYYIREMVQIFPAAKWYVDADPETRMIRPVFCVCDEGQGALCPVRKMQETPAAPQRPETISAPDESAAYAVYVKEPGEKSFALADMANGRIGVRRFYAPIYMERHLDRLKELLDHSAAENPGCIFQIRRMDKRPKAVYTAVPTYDPEEFAAMIAA